MFGSKKETGAQFYDRFLNRSALSMLMLAFVYTLDASRTFAADDVASMMKKAEGIFAILLMINLLPVMAKLMWFKIKRKPGCNDPDGFVVSTFKEAAVKGFTASFLAMLVALGLSQEILSHWSATVFLNIILALMLGVVSISFLLANREPEPDDDFGDDFDRESGA